MLSQTIAAGLLYTLWPAQHSPATAVRAGRFWTQRYKMHKRPSVEESIVQWQVYHLFDAVEPQDVVLIGDSSCLMGVMPDVITEETGLKAWNLGTVGTLSIAGHARILEQYLKKNGPPQVVVYHVTPTTLRFTQQDIDKLGYYSQFREWLFRDDVGTVVGYPLSRLPGYRLRQPVAAAFYSLQFQRKQDEYVLPKGVCTRRIARWRQTLLATTRIHAGSRRGASCPRVCRISTRR